MQTPNEIHDTQKYETIRESLSEHGWQGAPLVKWGDEDLITGSHRYLAAKSLEWFDYEIPMVDLEDVFSEVGLDFADLHKKHGCPTIDEVFGGNALLHELPAEIVNKYGIQY